jgi:hypothetical protein
MTTPAQPVLTVPDVVCLDDVDPFGRETTSDLQTLWQDVYHMLVEVLGSNIDDTERGIGIRQLLSGTSSDLTAAAARIDQGLEHDDRISSSSTTVTLNPDGSYTVGISIVVGSATVGNSYSYSAAAGLQVAS